MPTVESRPLGDGTVRYFVRIRDPRRGKFSSRTFATRPEADQFCRDIQDRGAAWALDQLDLEAEQRAEMTLDQWAVKHFDSLTEPAPDTVARYRRLYAAHWSPTLGPMRLSMISRTDVAKALNGVRGKDKTVLNAWGVLTHMLKMASQDDLIVKSPTVGVRPSRRTDHETVEHRYLTQQEFWRVLDATPAHWRPLVTTLGGTGMRWGEAAALTVGDINVAARTVSITKAEKRDPTNPSQRIVGPTKTKRSRRTVTLPDEVISAVTPLLDRKRGERLFLPPRGGPLRHKTFYSDIWLKTILAGAGLDEPQPRLHDLRHSHVAWLIAAGAPMPVIQARLGHEKIATTIDTYGHLTPDIQRAAADAAQLVFQRPAELA